jgi:ribosomal protein S18 acetylase RimI-like enzyme
MPPEEGLADWLEEGHTMYHDQQDRLHLVAEVDGVVVGSILASLLEPLDNAARQVQSDFSRRRLHIDSLGVLAAHRRTGAGTALMQAAEQWGRSHGAEVIFLETESNNPSSMPFYEQRMGFSAEAVIFRKELDPQS